MLRLELGRLDWFGRHGKSGRGHGFGHVKDPSERIPDDPIWTLAPLLASPQSSCKLRRQTEVTENSCIRCVISYFLG